MPQGNAATSLVCQDHIKNQKSEAEHEKKGNVKLTPFHVRRLRSHLLSTNDNNLLQLYVMILMGIKLFLRADELINMKMSDFLIDLQIVNEVSGVTGLAVKVKGKSDKESKVLVIWHDEMFPEFDLIKHLLLYVKCVGLTQTGIHLGLGDHRIP